jgi:hypothetical protein
MAREDLRVEATGDDDVMAEVGNDDGTLECLLRLGFSENLCTPESFKSHCFGG